MRTGRVCARLASSELALARATASVVKRVFTTQQDAIPIDGTEIEVQSTQNQAVLPNLYTSLSN